MKVTGVLLLVALAGVASTVACTLLVPANELQCSTAADCKARGPQFADAVCVANVCQAGDAGAAGDGGPWGCLVQPSLPSDPTQQVQVTTVVYDEFSPFKVGGRDAGNDLTLAEYTGEPGVSVKACSALDTSCSQPVSGPVLTDDAGVATVTVPGSFAGFYYLQRSGAVPTIFYPEQRFLAGEPRASYPTALTSLSSYMALQFALGVQANSDMDAGPGLLTITQFDCDDRHVPGVTFTTVPPPEKTLYIANALPSLSATQTSTEGSAALVNVPSGSVLVSSRLVGEGDAGTLSTANVFVHPGQITYVFLRPRLH